MVGSYRRRLRHCCCRVVFVCGVPHDKGSALEKNIVPMTLVSLKSGARILKRHLISQNQALVCGQYGELNFAAAISSLRL